MISTMHSSIAHWDGVPFPDNIRFYERSTSSIGLFKIETNHAYSFYIDEHFSINAFPYLVLTRLMLSSSSTLVVVLSWNLV